MSISVWDRMKGKMGDKMKEKMGEKMKMLVCYEKAFSPYWVAFSEFLRVCS